MEGEPLQIRRILIQILPQPVNKEMTTALMKADTSISREKIARMVLGQNLNEKVRDYIEQAGLAWVVCSQR